MSDEPTMGWMHDCPRSARGQVWLTINTPRCPLCGATAWYEEPADG